jgi:hypothetical protein
VWSSGVSHNPRAENNGYYVAFHEDALGYFVVLSHSAEHGGRSVPSIDGDMFMAIIGGDTAILASVNISGGDYQATFDMDVYIPNGPGMIDKYSVDVGLFMFEFLDARVEQRLEKMSCSKVGMKI